MWTKGAVTCSLLHFMEGGVDSPARKRFVQRIAGCSVAHLGDPEVTIGRRSPFASSL
jgi:hypothetical protein